MIVSHGQVIVKSGEVIAFRFVDTNKTAVVFLCTIHKNAQPPRPSPAKRRTVSLRKLACSENGPSSLFAVVAGGGRCL